MIYFVVKLPQVTPEILKMSDRSNKFNKQAKNCYLVLSQNNFMHGAFHRDDAGLKQARNHAKSLEKKNKEKYFIK